MKTPLEALAKLSAKRPTSTEPKPVAKTKAGPSPQLMLPLWPESVRAIPNAVLRGALFSVSQKRPIANDRELIATAQGVEIRYTGKRWNQVDLDLLEILLHLARLQPLGDKVEFTSNAVLKELGRGIAGKDHEELKNGIARLASGVVDIKWTAGKQKNKSIGGALVSTYFRDDETGRNVVIFNKRILALYEDGYSHVRWEERKALGNNSLAKWMHGWISSHAQPFPYKVMTLKTLCGSTAKRLSEFRKMLQIALGHLVEIGAIKNWSIDNDDLVHIEKVPTDSQHRHLTKKALRGLTSNYGD